ncbi:MAG: monomethylamine:corrinoid methyltransferase [Deltaproteobacteria bacterium]|nr:monomethylamine:corrinoid methyltransferase [Deltaproteobacteria bacterium]
MGKLLWEAIERSTTGPLMSEEKFETELFPTVLGDLQAKYKIEWDPEEPVMIDPGMADAIFQAGMDLLLEVGLYCKDTRRIIKFTQEEVLEAIRTARHEVTLGFDRQAITLSPRAPGDAQHPYTFFPAGALTKNVDLYKDYARTAMQEPTCDGVIPIPLLGVGELKNLLDTPAQTVVCQTEARAMNEVAAWAGKPGLFLGIPMSATTPLAMMNTFGPGLYTKHNCTLPVQILQDMRINYDRFNLAFFADQHGIEPWMSSSPALYAYLTGPEQAAMEIIAHTLGMLCYSGGALTQAMSISVHGTYVGKDISWCNSAAGLAAERNLKLPWVTFGSTGAPGSAFSDDAWYATALACINACISGMEGLWLAGGSTGIESRWAGEVARAAATLTPQEGVEIIKKIIAAEREPTPPPVTLDKLYDMKTVQPKQELVDQYRKFTRIFRDLGLDYPTWNH